MNRRAWLPMLLAILLLCSTAANALAASGETTLRVAFYPLEGFFEYDADGQETGYGVALLDKLTQYTGIHFTYVKADSWESTKYMLLDGIADVRMPATPPAVPSTVLGYTDHSIVDSYYALMCLDGRDDLMYEDYDAFSILRIGVSASLYESESIADYLPRAQIATTQLTFYEDYNACRDALENGEIDALISNIMDLDSSMRQLERFATVSNCISMTINNPYLSLLNDALSRIKLEDATFLANLYKTWFPQRVTVPLTRAELNDLADLASLRFSFKDGQGYLAMRGEDGEFTGFYPKLAQLICDQLGVAYTAQDSTASASGVVIYPDFTYDRAQADAMEMDITQSYWSVPYLQITRKGAAVDKSTCRVAAVQGMRVTEGYVADCHSPEQMVWCTDYADCIDAVSAGRADITYVNSYAAEYYMSLYRNAGLTSILLDYATPICFGVSGDDTGLLASALNKTLAALTTTQLNAIMVECTSVKPAQDLLATWVYANPAQSLLVFSGMVAVILLVVMLLIFLRITQRKNKALVIATNAKQDFLSRMSHDMRTPMNAIIGFSRFGVACDSLNGAKEYHRKTLMAGEYLLQLVNDSLDLSKLSAGKYVLTPEPLLRADFLDAVTNIVRPKADEKGVSLRLTYDESDNDPHALMFDKGRLEQIFINLLNNAIKFTQPGGQVTFDIRSEKLDAAIGEQEPLCFTVRDNGVGMSEQFQREKLFRAFEQEQRTASQEGTGLGLSIVKQLVDMMHGDITCHSRPGEGTTFTVRLAGQRVAIPQHAPASDKAAPQTDALKGKRVLLCEDHPLNTEIAMRLLTRHGLLPEHAENGAVGVAMFRDSAPVHFDAVLMDIRMPVMDGIEATRQIRALSRPDAARVPIIALTANAFEEDVRMCVEAGMNAHLAKPIDPDLLFETLAQLIADKP